MTAKVTLVQNQKLAQLLAQGGDNAAKNLAQALNEEAQLAFAASQRAVPHADGTLRSSGRLVPARASGAKVEVTIGYGGAASDYALRQHEDTSLRHPDPRNKKSSPTGSAKYLERPVRARVPNMQKNLSRRIKRILEGGS